MKTKSQDNIQRLSLSLISIPERIDREAIDPDYIRELAESIRELGLLQPILVRPVGDKFELIAGHRRLLAHIALDLKDVPARVVTLTDNEAVLARAVENLQRVDLTIIEEAKVYQAMIEKCGMSIDQIAKKLGKGPGMVRRKLSLLSLAPVLQEAIHKGKIVYSVAEELNSLGDAGKIDYYLGICVDHGATLGVVRTWMIDEKQKERQLGLDADYSRSNVVIPRSMPSYVPCDLCQGPMTIGTERVIRCCPACSVQLNKIIEAES